MGGYDLPCADCWHDRFSQPTITVISFESGHANQRGGGLISIKHDVGAT